MKKTGWKILAITLMVILFLIILFGVIGIIQTNKEIERTNICYYEVCSEYEQATYVDGVCECYDYDNLGYPFVAKSDYLK